MQSSPSQEGRQSVISNNSTNIIAGIAKFIIVELISYFKFSQITFAILMYGGMILLILVGIQLTVFPQIFTLPLLMTKVPAHIGTKDVINFYIFLSFIFYIISVIVKKFTNFTFNLNLKRKMLLAGLIPVIGYAILSILSLGFKMAPGSSGEQFYWVFLILCAMTIASGIYAVLASALLNMLIGILNGEQKSIKEYVSVSNWTKNHKVQA